MKTIIFSDIDGTLLNNEHKMTPRTKEAFHMLEQKHIPYAFVSARSPSGIYPILKENNLTCDIVSYSGGMIIDKNGNVLFSEGFPKHIAKEIISFLNPYDVTWNIYSEDQWIVANKKDPRVINEENIVKAQSKEGTIEDVESHVNKILCMCKPDETETIQKLLIDAFPNLNITRSSSILIEINANGISKAKAVELLCKKHHINIKDAFAFGDNFNDLDMLQCVGHPYLMENAPSSLKEMISEHTLSNNDDGIFVALKKENII
ncbi:Cof-type HAD-IIB family hydrolase [Kandleria vitulina]|uniref:Cof-type HAD-IIB family hydrolase n=1 Tax=Kandleria vitulina TaxID=1630 RepID=UPI00048E22CE|nr:Cof-type HAD-IIB family hydrolase [Kandleria vitulina]